MKSMIMLKVHIHSANLSGVDTHVAVLGFASINYQEYLFSL